MRIGQRVQLWAMISLSPIRSFLQKGNELGVANSILIKVNQIGTLSETLCLYRAGQIEQTTVGHLASLG